MNKITSAEEFGKYFSTFLEEHAFVSIKKTELNELINKFNDIQEKNNNLHSENKNYVEQIKNYQLAIQDCIKDLPENPLGCKFGLEQALTNEFMKENKKNIESD